MKLHSDTLTIDDVTECAAIARRVHRCYMQIGELCAVGSRKRRAGVSFKGYAIIGRYACNSGVYGADHPRAATWPAWGYLIAELFKRDPNAIIGQYASVRDFVNQCETMREWQEKLNGPHALDFLDVAREVTPA